MIVEKRILFNDLLPLITTKDIKSFSHSIVQKMTESQIHKLYTRELELKAILEVTQAINNNLPEEALYRIYHFTLRANLNITKLALYIWEDDWVCHVNFGTLTQFGKIPFSPKHLKNKEIITIEHAALPDVFDDFLVIIPVFHKDKPLAYVLVNIPDDEETDIAFIQTLTNIIIVAIENKKLARKELAQEAMNRELEIAKNVQTQLFPKNLPKSEKLKVKADYFPHQIVGGDYYDFIPVSENEFLICIADASGKGMSAALLMSNFQAALRVLIRQTTDLKQIIRELNFLLFQNTGGERFITFFVVLYNNLEKTFTYINSGHNPPVFCDGNKNFSFLEKGSIVLGAMHPLPFLHETKFENIHEFLFFAYTDGLTESSNQADEEFSQENIMAFLQKNHTNTLDEIHTGLMKELEEFCEGKPYSDDVTLLSCKVSH